VARRKQFGQLTSRSQDKIAQEGSRYGLTRRQSRERYNRGTFNPLARTPVHRIPQRAPYYPVASGQELKDRALRNMDAKLGDRLSYNREAVESAVTKHASDAALRRMAGASSDELESWAEAQRRNQYKGKQTPEWLRSLGWVNSKGKWINVFWYH
jgi:hypothetical protein